MVHNIDRAAALYHSDDDDHSSFLLLVVVVVVTVSIVSNQRMDHVSLQCAHPSNDWWGIDDCTVHKCTTGGDDDDDFLSIARKNGLRW